MASEWQTFRLGDICTKIGSGATPRGGSAVYLQSGTTALIRSQNIYNDGFHRDGLVYISEKHATELSNVEVHKKDVLLNITGDSVARVCMVDANILPARVNQHVAIIRPDPKVVLPEFLRYSLVSPRAQAQLLSWAGAGGTRKALTKGMIETFEITAPVDISEQRAIAHILGTLDDQIETLRRMNETLEGIARALFKAWFVDFAPVRAKMSGRWRRGQSLPGLPADLYDLFPDKLVPSELGEIPDGWKHLEFEHLVVAKQGKYLRKDAISPYPRDNKIYPVWGGNGIRGYASTPMYHDSVVVLTCRGSKCGRVELTDSPSWISNIAFACKPKFGTTYFLYIYFSFLSFDDCISGSAQPQITFTSLRSKKMIYPIEHNVVEKFVEVLEPIYENIVLYSNRIRTLAALRDALLPELISGRLRVADAEKFLQERGL